MYVCMCVYIYIYVKHFGMANIKFNGGNIFVPRKAQGGEKKKKAFHFVTQND